MVAQANREVVSGRRARAKRRGGKKNSSRNAAQLAQKLRSASSPGSWAQTGSRPGPKRKRKTLSVKEVDDPAKAREQKAEQERQQKTARVRRRREARAAAEQQSLSHDKAQQAAEEQQLQRSVKKRRGGSKKKASNQDEAEQQRQGESKRRKPKLPQPDFGSADDGEESFATFMQKKPGRNTATGLIVPAHIDSNTGLCKIFDIILASPSDLKNDICAELDVYGGNAEYYRLGCQLQGSRHDATPGTETSSKPSSLIYRSMGLVDENGVELKPFTLKRAEKIRRTAMLLHEPRYVLKFLNEKLQCMPLCTQAEVDDPIFYHQYKASLFKEYRDNVSGITAEEVANLRAPPPGMSHADLYILECCLLRFGITTVTTEGDDHYGDYFLCEEFRTAASKIVSQNTGTNKQALGGHETDSDDSDGDGFPKYEPDQYGTNGKSDKAGEDADADKDTDSDSEDSADSEEDAPPSEGAGDTDFVQTTPKASRHMDRILDGVMDVTTPGFRDSKSVKAEMSDAKMSEKFNNVKLSVKYDADNDPKKFFERFGFEVSQVHEALHFDKLKQTMKPTDVEAVTEALFEHVKSEPRYKQLKPKAQARFNFVFARDWLSNRDKRDITMYKIENRTAFDKLKQGKSKDPMAVQKFLLKLQEIQRKLGIDLCSNAMVRLQFLKGLNTALCKELMATKRFESLTFTRVYKRADRIWRTQIRANSFADANSGSNLAVAGIEKKPDSLEARFAAMTPERQLAALNGKPFVRKKKGGGFVKQTGAQDGKGALDQSSSYLPLKHMQDSTFSKLYSKEQQKERQQLRADNGQPTKKPHLFEKDAWHGKKVCVDCRKIGHHAGECRNAASKHSKQLALIKAGLKALKADGDSD